jgi:hypothetical protein
VAWVLHYLTDPTTRSIYRLRGRWRVNWSWCGGGRREGDVLSQELGGFVLLNLAVLVVSGLSDVLGAIGRILLSYLVHMHSRLRSFRQGHVHVGPITWEVLPQTGIGAGLSIYDHIRIFKTKVLVSKNLFSTKHIVWL